MAQETLSDFSGSGYLQGDTRIEDLRYQQGHEHDFSLEHLACTSLKAVQAE